MNHHKKALKEAWKARKVVGCVYVVKNTENGRYYLNYSDVSAAPKNSFDLNKAAGGAFKPSMAADWHAFGPGAFTFAILEELEKKETQSEREFNEDLKVLLEYWAEQFDPALRY